MKRIKYIIFFIQALFPINLSSQVNASFNVYCPDYDCALFCDALCKSMGKRTITRWLNQKVSFSLNCDLDSTGKVVKVNYVYMIRGTINKEKVIKKMRNYFSRHNINFLLCASLDPEIGVKEQAPHFLRFAEEYFTEHKTMRMAIGNFPHYFIRDYKEEYKMSLYKFFKHNIKKQLSCGDKQYFIDHKKQ